MSESSSRASYKRVGQGRSWFSFERLNKLESSLLMISSNVAVKSHHAGVVWNKTVNKYLIDK